ncbi:MAG: phytoene desaturase family protein [Flavobacteriaceae bacterium]|nr:phytoene desaturase family protein [Flavobacteriaceae bacterium]
MFMQVTILGSGFSSLSAAAYLAKSGYKVVLLEKNSSFGGRARRLQRDGFSFDMGPTWYWMPDIFDRFFADFGKKTADYYDLHKLNPAYEVYFDIQDSVVISDNIEKIKAVFESIETGAAEKLDDFMQMAHDNYEIAIKDLVYRPGVSPLELITPETIKKIGQFTSTISKEVRKRFKNRRLIQILEFPVLFLGAKPSDTPAFYSFMNQADFGLGTFHPQKGMFSVVEAMVHLCKSLGVEMHTNAEVSEILTERNKVSGVLVHDNVFHTDILLSGADYHHTESLLPPSFRMYSEQYWDKKTFAPSSLLFYVAFDKKIENVSHHTLFFDVDFDTHAQDIYDHPKWPENPLFYASFPSKTDDFFAPEGCEAATFLIPLAPGLEDSVEMRNVFFDKIMHRLELLTKQSLRQNIIFKESFCVNDFVEQYHSYKGNAYGMANTLFQTAFLRPKLKSKTLKNMYFTGQLTVPGPGVPPALISGKLVSELIVKHHPFTIKKDQRLNFV